MDAIYYSLAFVGSQIAPVQLARSLGSLRAWSPDVPVFVFLLGEPPSGFVEALRRLRAEVRILGDYRAYIARTQPERAEVFARNPTLHKWLILEEQDLKACARMLYVDSDTFFFAPATKLIDEYQAADLYAREEPFCRRSIRGYDASYIDEDAIAELRKREGVRHIPPFNTGVCQFSRKMADGISAILPQYFDFLFRFLSSFDQLGPEMRVGDLETTDERASGFEKPMPLPYPSRNRWIVDQIALWLALGNLDGIRIADFAPSDVWQGGEFADMSPGTTFPVVCHYFSGNMKPFFDRLRPLLPHIRAQRS